jgi:uracil-DNA glycosylase
MTEGDPAPARSLSAIAKGVDACRRCPLYKHATQGVPGEGPKDARLMLVGEQPGNDEDLAGHPFVGPAGRILNGALAAAGIDRDKLFVTNAVKHFKFAPRGKRRLHKTPNAHEIERCHWWLRQERRIVKPALVLALGATAARSLFGKPMTISKSRGKVLELPEGGNGFITIHPSLLLRIPDARSKAQELRRFTQDLRDAWAEATKK